MKLPPLFHPARPVPAEYRSNFSHLYIEIAWFGLVAGSAMAFVAVYATRQGANAFQIGLLSAGPAAVNLIFTLPAGRWLEKQPLGRAVFWSAASSRAFYLLWVLLPLLLAPQGQIWALIGLTLLMSIPGTALLVGFNALFADAVPPDWRAHVAGIRNALLSVTIVTASLLSGQILSRIPFPVSYQIVFGLGFLGAMMSTLHVGFVRPFPGGEVPPRVGRSLGDRAWPGVIRTLGDSLRTGVGLRFLTRSQGLHLLRADVLRSPFGGFVAVLFVFHLVQFLPIPLIPLYLVGRLHLSDREISLGNALMQTVVLLGSLQLAALTQRLGYQRLTAVGITLMSTYPALIGLSRGFGLYLVASFIGGFAWSLVGGTLNNYVLEKVPPSDRPAHLAWYNLAFNAAILLASLTGPFLAGKLGLSTALILFAISRLFAAFSILRWG